MKTENSGCDESVGVEAGLSPHDWTLKQNTINSRLPACFISRPSRRSVFNARLRTNRTFETKAKCFVFEQRFSTDVIPDNPLRHCSVFPSRIQAPSQFYLLFWSIFLSVRSSNGSFVWVLKRGFGSEVLTCWRWQKWVRGVLALAKQIRACRIRGRRCRLFDVGTLWRTEEAAICGSSWFYLDQVWVCSGFIETLWTQPKLTKVLARLRKIKSLFVERKQ